MSNTYTERQDAQGFKPGDKVKILRSATSGEDGWLCSWNVAMDNAVGKVGVITDIHTVAGIEVGITRCGAYFYPYFVLEKVEDEVKTEIKAEMCDNMWNTTCPVCNAPAYQGIGQVECSKGCLI
jgi:hypothetical protein